MQDIFNDKEFAGEGNCAANGIQPLNSYISNVAENIITGLPHMTNWGERSALKAALRSCIDTLEDLYTRI